MVGLETQTFPRGDNLVWDPIRDIWVERPPMPVGAVIPDSTVVQRLSQYVPVATLAATTEPDDSDRPRKFKVTIHLRSSSQVEYWIERDDVPDRDAEELVEEFAANLSAMPHDSEWFIGTSCVVRMEDILAFDIEEF